MADTLPYNDILTVLSCGECGITFAVPEEWRQTRREDHKTFYCPNGCRRWYAPGTSELEKTQQYLDNARKRLQWAEEAQERTRQELKATTLSLRAQKAAKTRLKNRIAAGVCPCCDRTFADLASHMAGEHPDFASDEPEPERVPRT